MRKAASSFLVLGFVLAMAGCGDGKVEVKSHTDAPNPVIIEKDKPTIIDRSSSTSTETTKSKTTSPSGDTTKTESTTTTH